MSLQTAASRHVEKTADGYTLIASIPWAKIRSEGAPGDIFGIDLELDLISKSGGEQESLGKKPGQSYKERFHYPLFKLPKEVIPLEDVPHLRNADFSEPNHAFWRSEFRSKTLLKNGKVYGMGGNGGALLSVPAGPNGGMNRLVQGIAIPPGKYHKASVWAMVKSDAIAKNADGALQDYGYK